jgi:hypothetical protein
VRAYLRLDPGFDEHKADYPDGPYATLIACFCLAEMQPQRGRFRSQPFLKALLGGRARHVKYLIDHADLIVQDDGRLYVDGWDEWQEGDWKVGERVKRVRNRKRDVTPDVKPDVTVGVTVGVTPDVTVPTVPGGRLDLSEVSAGAGAGAGGGAGERDSDEKTSKGLSQRARDPDAAVSRRQTNGTDDRADRIARARATLADPEASPALREVAIAQLGQLGAPLEPDPDEDLDFGQGAPA